jgi:hypothetical protein
MSDAKTEYECAGIKTTLEGVLSRVILGRKNQNQRSESQNTM